VLSAPFISKIAGFFIFLKIFLIADIGCVEPTVTILLILQTMHYISLLLMVLLVNLSVISAQITRTSYRVNFDVDQAELDLADKQVLDQILSNYRTATYGELQLTAHTDADAADDYNMQLSHRRANAVMAYFKDQGLQANRISVRWFGERKPEKSNQHTAGKSVNRRVDITLTQVAFAQVGDLIKLAAPEYKQSFAIDPTKDNVIKGRNGTVINIPKGSLVTKNGKPITDATVQIVLEEFLQPADAAFQQLSTVSDGRLLQSGGMFSIKAFANDEEVVLKKGTPLNVEMPSINMQKGMELFTAVANPEGIVEWKPTAQPFNPKGYKQVPPPFTKLDTKYLSSLKLPVPDFDAGNVHMTCDLPAFPKAPKQPVLAYTYEAPDKHTFFTWYQRWFIPSYFLNQKLEAEQLARRKIANDAQSRYNQKFSSYKAAYAKYVVDSAAYEQGTLEALRTWLRDQQQQHLAYVHFLESKQWNHALSQMITSSDNNTFTFLNPKAMFMMWLMPKGPDRMVVEQHKLALLRIDYLLTQSMANIVGNYAKNGILSLDMSRWGGDAGAGLLVNGIASDQLNQNKKLQNLFADAQRDILEQREKLGLIDQTIVSNVYATSLSGFGTFNCDRYDNTPPAQMATITVPYQGDARVSFHIPKTNSYIYASKTNKGYIARLPKGTPLKVVFVTFTPEDGPMMSIQQTSLSENTSIKPNLKSVTLSELQQGLASL
jgi:hypothetical protein